MARRTSFLLIPVLAAALLSGAAPAALAASDDDPVRALDKKTDKRMDKLQ